ncbi:hypothetical protein EYZ11_011673 [Aspergillus tanneri]|uniref:Fatty acyl-CoA reductase n=1 Tax=Aspergillus tanneri TaxID=1220188 RepID=A0A4S3J265_9EURO|nr:hypothetical protein EYZ11_011673 [Aspergillus tanneri]
MIWEYYAGKVIFITGGSGFLGTTLIYRLVKRAPVAHIYVLCRGGLRKLVEKWNQWLPRETVEMMTDPQLLTVLEGDMLLPDMGLAQDQLALLRTQAEVIVHAASSIALLKPLEKIFRPVIVATERLARLALGCERLECFVFVSTAYSNAHLYAETDGTSGLEVQETLYPLHRDGSDIEDIDQELQEVYKTNSSAAYRSHNFPWAYGYAKHLTERLLHRLFTPSNKRLLIVRPSIIEPAQCFPYRKFCIPMSTPHIIFAAGLALTLSRTIRFSSRFDNPYHQSSIDYVPVDVVVDRLLAHVAHGTHGAIHAVAGPMPFQSTWERTIKLRRIPSRIRPGWTRQSWHSEAIHPLARVYKTIGTTFYFVEKKTLDLWQELADVERSKLHLSHMGLHDALDDAQSVSSMPSETILSVSGDV